MRLCFLLAFLITHTMTARTSEGLKRQPNIVLIVGDDHDRSALGCYGNSQVKTPHLDNLASEGIRFTRAYATTASCSPSRSVLLSGRHNHNNGMYGLAHANHHFYSFENMQTLPGLLRDAGYRTGRIGKFHLVPVSSYPFDEELGENGSNPVRMADQCDQFLENNKERPFFLYFCPTDPHRTNARKDLPYEPDAHGNRKAGHEGVRETYYGADSLKVPYFLPDSPESRAELAQYYQSVSRLDQGVGRLSELLKKKGLWENTIVIYLSDNGMPVPGAKTTHYEPGVRLPLIVRNPFAGKKGFACDELVSWLDIAPTLLDLAGAALPEATRQQGPGPTSHLHGKSWKAVFDEPGSFRSDTLFLSHSFHGVTQYYPMRTIVTHRYKLIWNIAHPLPFPYASDLQNSATWRAFLKSGASIYGKRSVKAYQQRPPFELYDLEEDPYELVNKAYDPAFEAIRNKLQSSLKYFQKQTGDPWINKWSYE